MTSTTRRDFVKTAAIAPVALAELAHVGAAEEASAARTGTSEHPPNTERFDYVIAGAGHNSLVCAAYLAKAGYRILVLEGRAMIGGGCKTTDILLPGFKDDLCSSAHTVITRNPCCAIMSSASTNTDTSSSIRRSFCIIRFSMAHL